MTLMVRRLRSCTAAAAAGLLAVTAGGAPALAQSTGFDSIHEQRIERGMRCMVDHFHFGSSSGQPTRKMAEAAAIRDWAGFTVLEYGPSWGNFNTAGSKQLQCSQSGGGWGCEASARPCRRGR